MSIFDYFGSKERRAKQTRQLLNRRADYYEANEFGREKTDEDFAKYIISMKPKNALELGCGYGRMLRKLEGNGIKLTGIDFSEEMVKRAKRNCKEAEIILMDLTQTSFPDNSFDVVFSVVALFCVPDIEKAISEAKRIAKGKIIIREVEKENTPIFFRLVHRWYVNFYDYSRFGFTKLPLKETTWVWEKKAGKS